MKRRVVAVGGVVGLLTLSGVVVSAATPNDTDCRKGLTAPYSSSEVLEYVACREDRQDAALAGLKPAPTPTPTASPTPTVEPTPSPTAEQTPTPTPTASPEPSAPAVLDLPREPWDGGPDYWRQFPKADAAGWDDPSFFPIAVFFGKPTHAPQLKAVGVNTYMGAEHEGPLTTVTDQGLFVLAQTEWSRAQVGDNPRVVGWHVSDECEMGYSGCLDENDQYERLAVQRGYVAEIRGWGDGRFAQANFGNGVLRTWWGPDTMDDHVQLMDASSVDKYAYTSPGVRDVTRLSGDWPAGANPGTAAAYGWYQDQMERFQDPAKPRPNWVFVETARPYLTEPNAGTITPAQINGAVWSAIIHGARGISYFQHNNNGACGNYSLVECSQQLKDAVKATNAKVASLAPVLNTQTLVWDFKAAADTMLKVKDGSAYVFAGVGLNQSTGSKTFTLPPGVAGATVEVVGEGRTLPVVAGKFTDTFAAEHTSHVYKISLG